MATLKFEDLEILKTQIENSKDKLISKEKVLQVLHNKLTKADQKNEFMVDKLDGSFLKDLINSINNINPRSYE